MADDTITIASTTPMALLIHDLPDNPDRPGENLTPRSAVLNGNRHPQAVHGIGITRNVPADLFHKWLEQHPHLKQWLRPISDEDIAAHREGHDQFGHEPGVANADTTGQDQGSTVTARTVTAEDLAAVSTTPPDDSPRSQPPGSFAAPVTTSPVPPRAETTEDPPALPAPPDKKSRS